MIVDLHNHTPLCNHAEGTIDEYINIAIAKGIQVFGFSDHAPMDFDPKYRMSFNNMKKYEQDIQNAKKKYADKLTILLGYEVDYLEGHMDERVLHADVDYLIGSVHFIDKWGFDNPEFIGQYKNEDINVIWQKYFDTVQAMADSQLFDVVGHLDLIKVFKFMPSKDIKEIAKNALMAIKNANMSIEINAAGYRKPIAEAYPSKELLQEAFKLDIPITFSSDAHKPEQVGMFNKKVTDIAKDVGYTKCTYFVKRERKFLQF